jgi:hypothetical protein
MKFQAMPIARADTPELGAVSSSKIYIYVDIGELSLCINWRIGQTFMR